MNYTQEELLKIVNYLGKNQGTAKGIDRVNHPNLQRYLF